VRGHPLIAPRRTRTRVGSLLVGTATAAALTLLPLALPAPAQAAVGAGHGDSGPAVAHDTSAPLSSYTGAPPTAEARKGKKEHFDKRDAGLPQKAGDNRPDTALQTTPSTLAAPTSAAFEGVGAGLAGFTVQSAPPDTDAAVGPTQVVQTVNSGFAVFNKTGGVLYGPVLTNTLFSGFGGACQTTDDGDAVVRYDRAAGRWIIAQFANAASTSGPYFECLAVSTTGDATGSYYRYSFQYANFPDYPKLGVWPDAYYVTYNQFSGNTFKGAQSCAMDRAKMLTGAAATQQCFTTSTSYGGLLPVDNAGGTAPPAGEPALHVAIGATASTLAAWKFHVDWATPANSTFTGPTSLATAAFSQACGGGTCIPQSGTTNKLDSLADRLMYHLSYRNNGGTESIVLTHSVVAGTSTAVRWYELRNPTAPTIYQQGTYAPDASYRWMGSAAMDKTGGIAMGYSTSSSTSFPSIRYTGRAATDALGTMTAGEGSLVTGGGSQTGTLTRWGDYASMSIDPSDDCTFWFTSGVPRQQRHLQLAHPYRALRAAELRRHDGERLLDRGLTDVRLRRAGRLRHDHGHHGCDQRYGADGEPVRQWSPVRRHGDLHPCLRHDREFVEPEDRHVSKHAGRELPGHGHRHVDLRDAHDDLHDRRDRSVRHLGSHQRRVRDRFADGLDLQRGPYRHQHGRPHGQLLGAARVQQPDQRAVLDRADLHGPHRLVRPVILVGELLPGHGHLRLVDRDSARQHDRRHHDGAAQDLRRLGGLGQGQRRRHGRAQLHADPVEPRRQLHR